MPASRMQPAAVDHLRRALSRADTLRVRRVRPGVAHAYAWNARGPWAIHVLTIRRARCDLAFDARKAGPPLTARAGTSRLGANAIAAVNADFFDIPRGTTTGAHVTAGEVRIGPGDRPVFAITADGIWIGSAALEGTLRQGQDSLAIVQVNRPETSAGRERAAASDGRPDAAAGSDGVTLFTYWFGAASPVDSASTAVRIRRFHGTSTAGRGLVLSRDTVDASLMLDSAHVVFQAPGRAGNRLWTLEPGDTVVWHARVIRAHWPGESAREVVGGYPVLLRNGRVTATVAESSSSFVNARHPRTAVGVADNGRTVYLVTVDGRQEPYSAGMNLHELANFMRSLGAERALNLDGGGSTTMVVRGSIVNRPSDASGERPVGNALAVIRAGCEE